MLVCVGIFLIASAIVVLAWLKEYDEDEQDGPFRGLTTCRFDTSSEIFFSSANSLVSVDNTQE